MGEAYSAQGVLERLANKVIEEKRIDQTLSPYAHSALTKETKEAMIPEVPKDQGPDFEKAMELVLKPIVEYSYVPPHQLVKKKKNQRSRGSHF